MNIAFTFNKIIVVAFALAMTTIILYWDNTKWLYSQWLTDKAYSHGFFIPAISLYLVWCKKDFLFSTPPRPARSLGYSLIFICLLLLLIGRAGAIIQIEALSFFFIIPSIILLLYGWTHLKNLFLPIIYLQFMIPWMDPILERMHKPFQLISAVIGTFILDLKYPVYADHLNINLPHITMVVAKECSGINFLISVIAVGLPLVYLTQKTWFRAITVIIIGCILTVLSNGIRVAIAGYFGETYGPEMLHGPAHIFQGWSVAWFGWFGLFIVNWLFEKMPYRNPEPQHYLSERWRNTELPHSHSSAGKYSITDHLSVLFLILLSFTIYLNFFGTHKDSPLAISLLNFPNKIGGWQGTQYELNELDSYFPGLDNKLSRIYKDNSGNQIILYIGYYQKQDNEKRLTSYLSKALHDDSKIINLSVKESFLQAVRSSIRIGLTQYEIFFWYQLPGKIRTIDRLKFKLRVLLSGIIHRRNNGAVILLAIPQTPYRKIDLQSVDTMKSFVYYLTPEIDKFIP